MTSAQHQEVSITEPLASAHIADNVHVKSVINTETQPKVGMENTAKMIQLMSKLSSTHCQIDEYAKRRHEQISAETQA
ncbi:unnamed protein product [Didymodactylos carnosus]|uniref:Uncharacterized protein n=1 Tax=Didymodactylos carnosus TaxID=1234261 RepID=A0A814I473_9BILA|nr:unnamed protein product [Didymodactylos carnosus]CAF1018038.1 unnamed protein product [Didymodactylos carnosus]CAF3731625.1 unnamed protein product [Didymodactylos carnosus]CAF3789487.1 unnamed protein product [Didymodactylos carnosus]